MCWAPPVCCCAVLLRTIFAQRTAGASRHPAFPVPSWTRGWRDQAKLGRNQPRDGEGVSAIRNASRTSDAAASYSVIASATLRSRAPDAAQRPFDGALQSRGPSIRAAPCCPGSRLCAATPYALRLVRDASDASHSRGGQRLTSWVCVSAGPSRMRVAYRKTSSCAPSSSRRYPSSHLRVFPVTIVLSTQHPFRIKPSSPAVRITAAFWPHPNMNKIALSFSGKRRSAKATGNPQGRFKSWL
ncbi:hypothetical protein GGD63_000189 [Bradyrhizobium sp. cir1]|nr:hypothetical protein [Bradyrhizobium sp. cir1]